MQRIRGIYGGYVTLEGDEVKVEFPIGRASGPVKKSDIAEILTASNSAGIAGPFTISSNGLVVRVSEGADIVVLYHHEIFNAVT